MRRGRSGLDHPAMVPWVERFDELEAQAADAWG